MKFDCRGQDMNPFAHDRLPDSALSSSLNDFAPRTPWQRHNCRPFHSGKGPWTLPPLTSTQHAIKPGRYLSRLGITEQRPGNQPV